MVPVYKVKGNSGAAGVKVKVAPLVVGARVPEISVEPCFIVNVELLIVDAFMTVLKVAEITLLRTTSTALSMGSVVTTTGQRPTTSPVKSSFLHPAVKTTSSNTKDHMVLNILE